jgi:hypothetical protein
MVGSVVSNVLIDRDDVVVGGGAEIVVVIVVVAGKCSDDKNSFEVVDVMLECVSKE